MAILGNTVVNGSLNLTGAFNTANNTWNIIGDDSAVGDHNVAGKFCIKGLNGDAGIAFYNSSDGAVGTISTNGTFTFNKAVKASSFQATSDRRKKSDIKELLDIDLTPIKAYSYNLENKESRKVGLIAQEIQPILPEAVSKDSEGMLSLDYNAIVAVLVDKINRLEAKISTLESKQ